MCRPVAFLDKFTQVFQQLASLRAVQGSAERRGGRLVVRGEPAGLEKHLVPRALGDAGPVLIAERRKGLVIWFPRPQPRRCRDTQRDAERVGDIDERLVLLSGIDS